MFPEEETLKGQYAEFGRLLRQLRRELVLTQDGVRSELNRQGCHIVSKGTISKWENGDSRPDEDTVEALEGVLEVKKGTLLRPAGYPSDITEDTPTKPVYQGDVLIAERRKQHFEYLAEMADALLSNGLDSVIHVPVLEYEGLKYEYVGQSGGHMSREQLSKALEENLNEADAKFGSNDLIDLILHVAAEYEPRPKGLEEFFKENPFEFMSKLRILARSKIFKGTCPVCKDL